MMEDISDWLKFQRWVNFAEIIVIGSGPGVSDVNHLLEAKVENKEHS
jgi:hypothetical protein